jgi:hypothetical protein
MCCETEQGRRTGIRKERRNKLVKERKSERKNKKKKQYRKGQNMENILRKTKHK